jgi:hypothetical protein
MGLFPRSGRERLRNLATGSKGRSGKRRRRSSVRLSKIGWVGTRTENPEAVADFLRIR